MTDAPSKILLVEPDPDVMEVLVAALSRRFDVGITCVADAESCLDADMLELHDVVITETDLADSKGVELAEQLTALRSRPIILLAHDPPVSDVIEAMRLGVRDMFIKPFPVAELLDAVERCLRGHQLHVQHGAKYRRMRDLVRQVIHERRDLNRRMNLICRDLVGAQRRLVGRVLKLEELKPSRQE
jgi:DNA-binding NtrC family response regulator